MPTIGISGTLLLSTHFVGWFFSLPLNSSITLASTGQACSVGRWVETWSYPKYQEFPAPEPAAGDLGSLDLYRAWYRAAWFGKTLWTPGLEAYLRDITHIAADGRAHPTPSGAVLDALVASNFHSSRRYRDVRAM